jgi:hypothetical protein
MEGARSGIGVIPATLTKWLPTISVVKHGSRLALILFAVVLVGCDPAQQAWIENQSPAEITISADGQESLVVEPGGSGLAYSHLGSNNQAHWLEVFNADCQLVASTNTPANDSWLLRITVRSDGAVVFQNGASLSSLSSSGTVRPSEGCL